MKTIAVGDCHIEHCMKCGSSWFDAGEISRLLDVSGSECLIDRIGLPEERVEARHPLFCPVCRLPLKKLHFLEDFDITYRACTGCFGILLDYEEFTRLKRLRKAAGA